MVNVVLLGAPGSGKGTVARMLSEKKGLVHVSTGDLLRKEILTGTALGKKIQPILESGKLVDNAIVASVLSKAVASAKKGFVLDGFPRNFEQVFILEKILAETGQKIDFALLLDASDKKVIERLSSRRQCKKCSRVYGFDVPPKKQGICDSCGGELFQRKDDTPGVINGRLDIYRKETLPLISYFKKNSVVKKIDADKSAAEVFKQVISALFGK